MKSYVLGVSFRYEDTAAMVEVTIRAMSKSDAEAFGKKFYGDDLIYTREVDSK